jgi:putative nucleotidyltransferase with HDIG domain
MADKRILLADADGLTCGRFRQTFEHPWQVTCVASGTEALAELTRQPYEVLVASLDLAGLDGGELLNRVRKKYPRTARFLLASESDQDRVMKHVLGAHQFLSKQSEMSAWKSTIERSLALDHWIASPAIRDLLARIRTLPTIPTLYLEVRAALQSGHATTEEVGAIIARDMALMTKLLQLINSACFGLQREITDPAEAVGILGFETVKSVVMTIKLLAQYDKVKPVYFSIDRLWRHSREVARIAKQLVLLETGDRALADAAFTAGLLHDLGKIVLAANFDEQYSGVRSLALRQEIPLWEVEADIFGATHGEVGAYLLGRWGLPLDVLEAAALHHHPSRGRSNGFTTLAAVHIANVLESEANPDKDGFVAPKMDEAFLAATGLMDRLDDWRAAVRQPKENETEFRFKSAGIPAAKTPSAAAETPIRLDAAKTLMERLVRFCFFQQSRWLCAVLALLSLFLVWLGAGLCGR